MLDIFTFINIGIYQIKRCAQQSNKQIRLVYKNRLFKIMTQHKVMQSDELTALNEILQGSRYKPVNKISYGSYGEIFKVRDSQREYVLKVVSKERMAKQSKLHEAVVEGFVLSKLHHPGIIGYYQTIQTKQYICQVLEYCPFGDLFSVLKKVNKNMELALKKKQIAHYYLAQVLEGIAYLHSMGLIHRDIKLENIVIGSDLHAKLVDFGTAKPIKTEDFYLPQQAEFIAKLRNKPKLDSQEQQITRTKSFVGSANYLSPESISLQYSFASDIWSYGILAYKIFHGKLPFDGENNYQVFKKIRQNKFNMNEKLQPDIQDLIRSCLRINPEDRPTVNELKMHVYFKGVDFNQVFKQPSPINKDMLLKMYNQPSQDSKSSNFEKGNSQFEIQVQKKMFFGNHKPRILKVYRRGEGLYMSYWYVDGKAPKNQFQLMISDYAQQSGKGEFDVHNKDVKYSFKAHKGDNIKQIVESINNLIRKHYQL